MRSLNLIILVVASLQNVHSCTATFGLAGVQLGIRYLGAKGVQLGIPFLFFSLSLSEKQSLCQGQICNFFHFRLLTNPPHAFHQRVRRIALYAFHSPLKFAFWGYYFVKLLYCTATTQ